MPNSKLSALCDGIIEAGWLATVVTAPLFINIYSSRSVEPDRSVLLRSIATVMAVAWFIKWIEQKGLARSATRAATRSSLLIPALCVAGVYLLTTLTSIVPRISFFGSYPRPEGAYAVLAYLVVFALIAQGLRTRAQFDRLIFTLILTSVPVALYGLVQLIGLDPFVWSREIGERISSTMGNPIFLGAFLLFPFALAVGKTIESARILQNEKRNRTALTLAIVYGGIALLHMVVLLLTASRGPFLGWVATLAFLALTLALVGRRLKWARVLIALGVLGALALGAMNIPNSPLAGFRDVPTIGRLATLAVNPGDSASARLWYWEGVARLVAPHAPLQFPGGTVDALNSVRPLIGYGPDSLYLTYNQFYPPELLRLTSYDTLIDRSHNETWDVLAASGLLGLVGYQAIFLCVFVIGLRRLGLLASPRERNWFVGLWIGLGALGVIGAIASGHANYTGLALAGGTILGVFVYLGRLTRGLAERPSATFANASAPIILTALLAGILGHYVEIQFGLTVAATREMFWVFVALVTVICDARLETEPAPIHPVPQSKRAKYSASSTFDSLPSSAVKAPAKSPPAWSSANISSALIITLVFVTLLNLFVKYVHGNRDVWDIVARGLTDTVKGSSPAILVILALTWVTAIVLMLAATPTGKRRQLALLTLLPFALAFLFAFGLALQLIQVAAFDSTVTRVENIIARAERIAALPAFFLIALGVLWMALAVTLAGARARAANTWCANKWSAVAIVPVFALAFVWLNLFSLNPIRADIFQKLGNEYDDQRDFDAAIAMHARSIMLVPAEDYYYMALGRSLALKADAVTLTNADHPTQFNEQMALESLWGLDTRQVAALNRLDLLYAAQASFLRARTLAPLFPNHTLNLARFYLPELPVNTDARTKLADRANDFYAQAIRISPNNIALWNEWAKFELEYRNNPDAAMQKLERARALDAPADATYLTLGKVYAAKKDWDNAITAYERALALKPTLDAYIALGDLHKDRGELERAAALYQQAIRDLPTAAQPYSRLAFVDYQQGNLTAAIQGYAKYIEMAPKDPNLWEAHKNLALLFKESGDLRSAIRQVELARDLAPNETKTQLDDLVKQWRAQASLH